MLRGHEDKSSDVNDRFPGFAKGRGSEFAGPLGTHCGGRRRDASRAGLFRSECHQQLSYGLKAFLGLFGHEPV